MDISKELGAMTTIEVGASAVYGDEAVPACLWLQLLCSNSHCRGFAGENHRPKGIGKMGYDDIGIVVKDNRIKPNLLTCFVRSVI